MAHQLLTALDHRAVAPCLQAAIAHLQRAALGREGKQARHAVACVIEVGQLVSEHKHPAAFGVERSLLHERPQRAQASRAAAELGSVLFGETARQDQALGVCRDGLIGQGAPAEHGHAHVLQQFTGFLVAEVKGGITG